MFSERRLSEEVFCSSHNAFKTLLKTLAFSDVKENRKRGKRTLWKFKLRDFLGRVWHDLVDLVATGNKKSIYKLIPRDILREWKAIFNTVLSQPDLSLRDANRHVLKFLGVFGLYFRMRTVTTSIQFGVIQSFVSPVVLHNLFNNSIVNRTRPKEPEMIVYVGENT